MAAAAGFLSAFAYSATAHAEGPSSFFFPFFSNRRTPSPTEGREDEDEEGVGGKSSRSSNKQPRSPPQDVKKAEQEESKVSFDPEALERGARVLREINNSANSKKVSIFCLFELVRQTD